MGTFGLRVVRGIKGVLYGIFCLQHVAFTENEFFKSSNIICLLMLPSTLPDELLTDARKSNEFFSR